jgi:hypothetical protein
VASVVRTAGSAIEAPVREPFERALGHDFSGVRIHADETAAESAAVIGAAAYTVGRDVVFNAGRYAPSTAKGQQLLGHELVHVIQQSGAPADASEIRVGSHSDPAEAEADEVAAAAVPFVDHSRSLGTVAQRHAVTEARRAILQRYDESTEPPSAVSEFLKDIVLGPVTRTLINVPCLNDLEGPMGNITFNRWIPHACSHEASGFLASPNWDAFGHCWIGCEGTRKCGESPTAILGTGREVSREMGFGGPHDSFRQDVRNQAAGRRLAHSSGTCYTLCDGAARSGGLDLSAPRRTCANCASYATTGSEGPCP